MDVNISDSEVERRSTADTELDPTESLGIRLLTLLFVIWILSTNEPIYIIEMDESEENKTLHDEELKKELTDERWSWCEHRIS